MKKKTKLLVYSTLAGCAAGTLLWEILEKILEVFGVLIDLTAGPVGFDIYVVSFFIRLNPGTVLGGIIAFFTAKRF